MALFGISAPKSKQPAPAPQNANAAIFDVTTQEFEVRVMQASMEKPVLVDFWAPWCGPCKQLMPVLEAEVAAANGDVLLAKVNIDENRELAEALRIQSVPTVLAFFQGQPVTGFTGARPASELKKLIAQLVQVSKSAQPGAIDIPAALAQAASFMANKDFTSAQDIYFTILEQDEHNGDAYAGLVRTMVETGALEEARTMLDNAPDDIAKNPNLAAVRTALDIAEGAGEAAKKLAPLVRAMEANPDDPAARFDLAQAQYAAGQKEQAIDNLLHLVRTSRDWNNDAARLELLRYFEALGFADPLAVQGRKKLSRLLFS